ncbi:MAG: hypothetical protein H8E89_12020 [Candidatus Nitrosopelagicus sp.]|nr:hypothetical protein [Candidatus Nitrosopelagicus sp.]
MQTLSKAKDVIIDFGTRAISKQNFSRMVCIPKSALVNLGVTTDDSLKVELVECPEDDERYLKLTPVMADEDEEDEDEEDDEDEDDEDEEEDE